MTQINPPFDGSKPCPACQQELRGMGAYLHNAYNRWGEAKMYVKLNDLLRFSTHPDLVKIEVPHPAAEALLQLVKDISTACEGLVDHGLRITWTPEVTQRLHGMRDRVEEVLRAWTRLVDAHFVDQRHSSSCGMNIIRESRGAVHVLSGGYSYHYTVKLADDGRADLRHTVCGARFQLHEHFKEHLAEDPTFYDKVYCPVCKSDLPFRQFVCEV